jgi:hypothetical protein
VSILLLAICFISHIFECLEAWWFGERSKIRGDDKRKFDTVVCTLSYMLWKNRNAWVFLDGRRQHNPLTLAALVSEEYNMLKKQGQGSRTEEQELESATARE